jgi:hypothetical protein
MSSSAYAYIVVGAKLKDIGRVFIAAKKFKRFNVNTGQPYEVDGQQTVIEIAGKKVPDDPVGTPVRNWKRSWGSGDSDVSEGTDPKTNLYWYLIENDPRWEHDDCKINMDMIGVCALSCYSSGYRDKDSNCIIETIKIDEARKLCKELFVKLGITQEPEIYLVSELS